MSRREVGVLVVGGSGARSKRWPGSVVDGWDGQLINERRATGASLP